MKKQIGAFFTAAMLLFSCSVPVQAAQSTPSKVLWEYAGDLSPQKGYDKNIGVAGVLSGRVGNYILIGGGANFPEESAAVGGTKKLYPDVYLLKAQSGTLQEVSHIQLEYEIAYGSSITTDKGVYYIGGSSDPEAAKYITLFTEKSGKINTEKIGELPFTLSDGFAVEREDKIYVGAGKQDGTASNRFYCFDIKTGETKELKPVPGQETRNQSVAQILNNKLYVFSGGDKVAYTDGYQYDFDKNEWSKIADVEVNGEKISLLGASSVALNENEMLVLGGFHKETYDNAVEQLNSLKDEALANFKAGYFGADPWEFQWNRKILIYNAAQNRWKSIGEVPFDAPCGAGLVLNGGKIYSMNGEIKPGTRTSRMYCGTLMN